MCLVAEITSNNFSKISKKQRLFKINWTFFQIWFQLKIIVHSKMSLFVSSNENCIHTSKIFTNLNRSNLIWHYRIWHKQTQHNPSWHNLIWHYRIWHKQFQHNPTWNNLTWHNLTQHNPTWHSFFPSEVGLKRSIFQKEQFSKEQYLKESYLITQPIPVNFSPVVLFKSLKASSSLYTSYLLFLVDFI